MAVAPGPVEDGDEGEVGGDAVGIIVVHRIVGVGEVVNVVHAFAEAVDRRGRVVGLPFVEGEVLVAADEAGVDLVDADPAFGKEGQPLANVVGVVAGRLVVVDKEVFVVKAGRLGREGYQGYFR